MTPEDRQRLRTALRIHERLAAEAKPSPSPLLPLDSWRELLAATRRVVLADERGWASAAVTARNDYRRLAASLTERLGDGVRNLSTIDRHIRVQSSRDILADLVALEAEFAEVELDLQKRTLGLTTDPIVLEGVDLGRFQILLHWDQLPDASAYEVIALDPHPAASDETTTHPHVRDDGLCEGEGRIPIRRALEQGRLFDFGLLVRGVLQTYNAGSAYVPLSRWQGSSCSDCGYLASEDESSCCEHCSSELCLDCSMSCHGCGRSCCGECRDRCEDCDDSFCPNCFRSCADCGESRCRGCLDDSLCRACREADEIDATVPIATSVKDTQHDPVHETLLAETQSQEQSSSFTSLHTFCLGEAAVPA